MSIKQCKLLLLFLLFRVFAVAQTAGYHYQANINKIDSSGFYNIVLTPEINAHLKTDYSDLRIVNDSGKWIPHIFRARNTQYCGMGMQWDLKIIKRENNNQITDLVIKSTSNSTSKLVLNIKNSLAERYCSLSGSDDLESWYIITDSISIKPSEDGSKKTRDFDIQFPVVTYKYFKIHINNNGKDPLNIISVQSPALPQDMLIDNFEYFSPIENPLCRIEQKDSGNISYIRITQTAAYHFNLISFKLSGAKYFSRIAELYFPAASSHSFSDVGSFKQSITLSNNSALEFPTTISNPTFFYLVINNEDNPPLKFESVKTYITPFVATAWLEKGNHYKLVMNNVSAVQPNYDLRLNYVSERGILPNAVVNKVVAFPQQITTPARTMNNKWTMWLLIIIAISVLAFFTYKLITDINKSKS